jgi:hypothetical protein
MIRFACPSCKSVSESCDDKAGQKTACPKCGQWLQVPTPGSGVASGTDCRAKATDTGSRGDHKTSIFISYRREDSKDIVGRIYDRLEAYFGREKVFLDIDKIPLGADFRERITHAVGQCGVLLVIIGEHWLEVRHGEGANQGQRRLDDPSDFVRIEIEAALTRDIPVIPVLVSGAKMPGEQQLPEGLKELAYRNAAEVGSGRDFHDHVDRLVRAIKYLGLSQARQPQDEGRPARTLAASKRQHPVRMTVGGCIASVGTGICLRGS